jgi:hypothetical protein
MKEAGALPSSLAGPAVGEGAAPSRASAPERAPGWQAHALVLAICLGAIAAGLALSPDGSGAGLTAFGLALPELCALRGATGLPCPGCGLTRSWVAMLRGDPLASLSHHLLGWLVLLYAGAQATRHLCWLAVPGRRHGVERAGASLDRGLVPLGVAMLALWIPALLEALARSG